LIKLKQASNQDIAAENTFEITQSMKESWLNLLTLNEAISIKW